MSSLVQKRSRSSAPFWRREGLTSEDFLKAIRAEFREQEDLPNTTHPDDWAKIAGKKGEKIIHVRTLTDDEESESREIATMNVGHYF